MARCSSSRPMLLLAASGRGQSQFPRGNRFSFLFSMRSMCRSIRTALMAPLRAERRSPWRAPLLSRLVSGGCEHGGADRRHFAGYCADRAVPSDEYLLLLGSSSADNVLDVTPIKNYDQCVATGVGQPCSDLWVQDGFYITLDDLSVGTHVLQFQAGTPGFSLSVTDTLNVVPEPSTWTMMLVGFTGLSFAAYWRRRTQRPPVAVPRRTGTGVDREDRELMTGLYAERQLHP